MTIRPMTVFLAVSALLAAVPPLFATFMAFQESQYGVVFDGSVLVKFIIDCFVAVIFLYWTYYGVSAISAIRGIAL